MSSKRRYVPSEIWGDRLHSDKFENHSTGMRLMMAPYPGCELCSECGFLRPRTDGIIIATDGACRDNGRPSARAAYGVYFNATSGLNTAGLLVEGPMTNQRAEITAAIEAFHRCYFDEALLTLILDGKIRQIVIKSDSAYLVNSMVTYVETWRDNNYKTSRGTPVVNEDLLRRLDMYVDCLEKMGVDVRFWHVPRAQNKQADKLANAALDGVDHRQFTEDDFGLSGDGVPCAGRV